MITAPECAVLGQTMDVVLNSTGKQTFLGWRCWSSAAVLSPLTSPDPLDTARERALRRSGDGSPDRFQMQEIARPTNPRVC